jgi:hypothetical protein
MKATFSALLISLLLISICTFQTSAQDSVKVVKVEEKPKKWFETMKIGGYAQVRYNRLLETNPDLKCDQCDKSIGENGGIFIRRARLIFSGKLHDRVYFYFQPDFASNVADDKQQYLQVRDLYFDVFLDKKEVYRFRIGQSKVPFGYDNLQSSSRRLNLDRSDPINSAAANERDLGLFFYYSPESVQRKFKKVYTSTLKGTGDYGMFGFGVYNGQTGNIAEANNSLHVVARTAYPFEMGKQNFEVAAQAYTGKFVLIKGNSKNTDFVNKTEFTDRRTAVSFTLFPQPFGLQAEYNVGKGPRFHDGATLNEGGSTIATDSSVQVSSLKGGYVLMNYVVKRGKQSIIPFARVQYYDGGKKHEEDARSYTVYETEFGIEWQPVPSFELTVAYNIADRTYEDYARPVNTQTGNFLRIQAQVNF